MRSPSPGDGGTVRLQMREKVVAIGDDSWVDDESGNHVYKVNGKAARLRDTFVLETPDGTEVAKIRQRPMHLRDTMTIEQSGTTVATISKKWFRVRDTYGVEIHPTADVPLILAVTVAVDDLSHD